MLIMLVSLPLMFGIKDMFFLQSQLPTCEGFVPIAL